MTAVEPRPSDASSDTSSWPYRDDGPTRASRQHGSVVMRRAQHLEQRILHDVGRISVGFGRRGVTHSWMPAEDRTHDRLLTGSSQDPSTPARPIKITSRWLGQILELQGDTFTARLIDPREEHRDLIATFGLDDVSDDDSELVEPGAEFYWTVGLRLGRGGRRQQVSTLRLRRRGKWTREQQESVDNWVNQYESLIRGDEDADGSRG